MGPNARTGAVHRRAAAETGRGLGQIARETGNPLICVARPPTSELGMSGTLSFRDTVADEGLPCFSSVSAAALALRRMLDWQQRRS